ncbi:amidohydrolase family protein [Pseudonocardia kujensis]|uniref:amidohydrolase family protein n=1 Tax=Pseudonocardia kujensis TaxID=1128675 RepID=UPI001E598B55|nr:amidohydrolase family protein [Pseudonocardia kujensis]MCE0764078.1 amidohydrolase family protein [Pseudonocardia kujensis]
MATEFGAEATGRPGVTGRFEVGAVADLVVLRPRAFELTPVLDVAVSVLLHSHPGVVDTVLVGGRRVKSGGNLTGVEVAHWARRSAEVGYRVAGAWRAAGGLHSEPSEVERTTLTRLTR